MKTDSDRQVGQDSTRATFSISTLTFRVSVLCGNRNRNRNRGTNRSKMRLKKRILEVKKNRPHGARERCLLCVLVFSAGVHRWASMCLCLVGHSITPEPPMFVCDTPVETLYPVEYRALCLSGFYENLESIAQVCKKQMPNGWSQNWNRGNSAAVHFGDTLACLF